MFELELRALLLKAGAEIMGQVVQALAGQIDAAYQPRPMERRAGSRSLQAQGIFGSFSIKRSYYLAGGDGHFPADSALALEGSHTPALAQLICRAGSQSSYQEASADLWHFGGIQVSGRQIQRLTQKIGHAAGPWLSREPQAPKEQKLIYICADGTGVPMRGEELRGRKGKQPDGSAKTREVKLGCAFLQSRVDEQGHPLRD